MPKDMNARSAAELEQELEETRRRLGRAIDAIQVRMTPGQVFQEFYDLARGGPTDYVHNLGLAAKNNPVPVALVAVGLTWLATSGGRTPSYLRGARQPSDATQRPATDAALELRDQAGTVVERVGAAASATSERVREMADDARDLAAAWSEDARATADASRARMRAFGETAQNMTARLRDSSGALWREQPLVVGAVGVALGALLGALLPSTESENATMGEARDRLVDKARALGEDAVQEATATAADMAGAAMEAVDRRTIEGDAAPRGPGQDDAAGTKRQETEQRR